MGKEQIQSEISTYSGYINSNNDEIKKLHHQLHELLYTKGKLNDSQNKLYDYRTTQKQTYQGMQNNHPNNRFAANFSEGMLGCLDGAQSAKAHENISIAIQKVQNKISSIESKIQELNSANSRYRNVIADLEYELRQLEIKE